MRKWVYIGLIVCLLPSCAYLSESEKRYYDTAVQMMALRKPILYMEAIDGKSLEIKNLKKLAIYLPLQNYPYYKSPWAKALENSIGVIGAVAGIYFGGQVAVDLANAVGSHAGTHISNSFNPTASQSPSWFNTGTANPTITTTTTTTSE